MTWLRRFIWRIINAIRPGREEATLDREVASHLLLLQDDFARRGMSAENARRAARLALGGIDQTKERHRDARSFRWLDDLRRDAAYAVRMLSRHPAATITTALSLAIGIGLNTAVFTVVDWVLLRPLPYPAPHELVRVFSGSVTPAGSPSPLTHDEFQRLGRAAAWRASVAFTTSTRVMSAVGADPSHVLVARITGDLFATLGVSPERGRAFTAAEVSAGAPLVVLGHEIWQSRLSSDPAIVGRSIAIDGVAHTVVGVMPRGRGYPPEADLWRPLTASEHEDNDRELAMVGRLNRGVTGERATAEIATLAQGVSNGSRTAWVDEIQRTEVRNVSAALQALFAAAMLTLLIACANVAALVVARGADRAGEIAVRGALGATRARVLSQLIVESLVLACLGGALGLLIGRWALAILIDLAPIGLPRLPDISLDARILAIAMLATLATGLIVGLGPARRLSRLTQTSALNQVGWVRVTARSNGRRLLVVAQIATAIVLTTGALLLTRSLQHLVTLENGFDADRLVAIDLSLRGSFSGDTRQLFRDLVTATESLPGVQRASVAMRLPTQVPGLRAPTSVVGERELDSPATLRPVGPSYFETVGITVTAGRPFTSSDGEQAPRVAIVNQSFAHELLDGRAAVGMRLTTPFGKDPLTVVGVVGDATPAGEPDRPALYVPLEQLSIGGGYLIVRTQGDPRAVIPSLASRLRETAPTLAADRIRRVAESLEESRAITRFSTQVTGTFAALALMLSMIGVYGLTAGDVASRWRELAVRLALGASRFETLWCVLRPSAAILTAGAILGVGAAISVRPALASLLHGIAAADFSALVIAPAVLAVAGIAAALLAAKPVLQSDPATTLRNE